MVGVADYVLDYNNKYNIAMHLKVALSQDGYKHGQGWKKLKVSVGDAYHKNFGRKNIDMNIKDLQSLMKELYAISRGKGDFGILHKMVGRLIKARRAIIA